ncbi:MAG: hypothetical protein ABI382_03120 [Nakamurella sp.]
MRTLPRNPTDLYLAPVVLAIDARIDRLGQLDADGLRLQVALESDAVDWTRSQREDGLIRTIGHLTDVHGWELSWDARGLRLTHQQNTLVLGVPPVFATFLDSATR